ncbi:MAG: hypothetical protein TEF_15545 [Rhizobiales bacterium NRL2]|jgi:uncharacterized membrane protein|nr:MAG: hypothetical protein TEF_15545 [Rhizobiales bacterium NRL2]
MKVPRRQPHIVRYLLSGILAIVPLWLTWIIFDFILGQLARIGMPGLRLTARRLEGNYPDLAEWMLQSWIDDVLAALITLLGLYLIGWVVNQVIGRRLFTLFENALRRLPLVETIYGSIQQAIAALKTKPEGTQRVVLINFPSPEMQAVGFVTKIITEEGSGRQLAAVYVPTTPNPTSGYLELVPVENLTPTDWTLDEAMNFVISAGSAGPSRLNTTTLAAALEDAPPRA